MKPAGFSAVRLTGHVSYLGALGKDLLPSSFRLLTDPVPRGCMSEVPISVLEARGATLCS